MSEQDPRRNLPLQVTWEGGIPAKGALGRITIAGELWAFVEWSEKRGEWCIEDSKGRCLRHASDLRGTANNHESAIELAMAMIRDGRMPTPEEARTQRFALSAKPANVRARQLRREQRERSDDLMHASWQAKSADRGAPPLWEALAEAFDFSDPALWRSNSFASLRPRLVIWMHSVVAELEYDLDHAAHRYKPYGGRAEPADAPKRRVAALAPRVAKARKILALLEDETDRQAREARDQKRREGQTMLTRLQSQARSDENG